MIRHHDYHELIMVNDEHAWLDDTQLSRFPYDAEDRLIDSRGRLFMPVYEQATGEVNIKSLDAEIGLTEFSRLLRKHLCVQNDCCISKLTVSSYQQGFEIVAAESES